MGGETDELISTWISQAKERQSEWQQYKSINPGKLLDASNKEKVEAEVSNRPPEEGITRPSE